MLDNLKDEFTLVSTDESFFFYDCLVRKVWIIKDERPVVRITGSHQKSILFGATSLEGKQLFKQYNRFNASTFLDYLKQIHRKFPKCYLFLDKAKQHYKSKKVLQYFDKHKKDLVPVYLPTASPEFMVLEEIWHITKNDLVVVQYYPSFTDFKNKLSQYFRTKRFNLDMRKYLLEGGS
ncbi:MAG: transposase [Nitrososphaeraceae archaeon]|nr:transposase [Nitrososphaeraceae archaeon]